MCWSNAIPAGRHRDTNQRGADREHAALGQQQANQTRPRRAERRSNGQLAPAAGHAREQQAGRIGAGDEPHHGHRGHRDAGHRLRVADKIALEVRQAPRRTVVLIRRAPHRKHPRADQRQLGRRRTAIGFPAQASDGPDEERTLAQRLCPLGGEKELPAPLERPEGVGEHADQRVVGAVEMDGPADRAHPAGQPIGPERMADDDRRRMFGLRIVRRELAADRGPEPQQIEVTPGDDAAANQLAA